MASGWRLGAVLVVALAAVSAHAVELGNEDDLLSVEVHAFASQGFLLTFENNYLNNNTTHGSFEYSEIGLNFTKSLTDKLRLGLELYAQDVGPTGSYSISMDWFYVDYRWKDWLGLRVGRVKIPFGLYNELQDIDSGRVPILLPQSIYPLQNVNYLLAQTGGELYGYLKLAGAGALDYHAYLGTIFINLPATSTTLTIQDLYVPFVAGGRLLWETPLDGLRVGASFQALQINADLTYPGTPSDPTTSKVSVSIPALLWVASAEYAKHDLLLSAEYSQWYVSQNSSDAALFPAAPVDTSQRGYVMASYRETRWLQTGAYFSVLIPNAATLGPRQTRQNDLAATLRFDINAFWLVKLEGHYMVGTAGLSSSVNDGIPLSQLANQWGVLMLETTAHF